jgi:hypothetical protein
VAPVLGTGTSRIAGGHTGTVTGSKALCRRRCLSLIKSHRTNGRVLRSEGSSIRPSRGCPGCWAAVRHAQDNARAGHKCETAHLSSRHGPYAGAAPGRARSESHILPRAKSAMRAGANPQGLRNIEASSPRTRGGAQPLAADRSDDGNGLSATPHRNLLTLKTITPRWRTISHVFIACHHKE